MTMLLSFSALAAGESFQETRSRRIDNDVFLRVGNCQTTGQLDQYMPLTTTLQATVRRTSVTVQETRTCRKTGWGFWNKSCSEYRVVSRSAPVVSITSKNAFYDVKPKCDGSLPGVSDAMNIMNMMDNCRLMEETIKEEIAHHRQ